MISLRGFPSLLVISLVTITDVINFNKCSQIHIVISSEIDRPLNTKLHCFKLLPKNYGLENQQRREAKVDNSEPAESLAFPRYVKGLGYLLLWLLN